jgi:broad specificity phosphatase PhoE
MDIHLIRHSESEWHLENKYAGHTDICLTKTGKKQSQDIALWASSLELTGLYSSNSLRATQTAKPISDYCKIPLRIDSRLREVNFGTIEGLNPMEFRLKHPDLYRDFLDKPAETVMPEGESGTLALERAWGAVEKILIDHPTGNVLVIAHGTLIRLIACRFLGIDLNEYRRVFPLVPNAGRMWFRTHPETSSDGRTVARAGLIKFDQATPL